MPSPPVPQTGESRSRSPAAAAGVAVAAPPREVSVGLAGAAVSAPADGCGRMRCRRSSWSCAPADTACGITEISSPSWVSLNEHWKTHTSVRQEHFKELSPDFSKERSKIRRSTSGRANSGRRAMRYSPFLCRMSAKKQRSLHQYFDRIRHDGSCCLPTLPTTKHWTADRIFLLRYSSPCSLHSLQPTADTLPARAESLPTSCQRWFVGDWWTQDSSSFVCKLLSVGSCQIFFRMQGPWKFAAAAARVQGSDAMLWPGTPFP